MRPSREFLQDPSVAVGFVLKDVAGLAANQMRNVFSVTNNLIAPEAVK